jgi:hypothetical protein
MSDKAFECKAKPKKLTRTKTLKQTTISLEVRRFTGASPYQSFTWQQKAMPGCQGYLAVI